MRRVGTSNAIGILVFLFLSFGPVSAATDMTQDISDLRNIQGWHVSKIKWTGGPDAARDRVCGIKDLSNYDTLRLDSQLGSQLSDSEATSQIAALDRTVSAFLAERSWSKINLGVTAIGIPDLSRCFRKQTAIAQIYKTTGRCTMNSPCTAYDGFTVISSS